MLKQVGLWGNDFIIPENNTKELIKKTKKKKEVSIEKLLKSDKTPLDYKLEIIQKEVDKALGKEKDLQTIIFSRDELHDYITQGLENKFIAIDTETNNSLDSIHCKIMGLCLYTENKKQAYVPINHRNPYTKERLTNQLTEQDLREELSRLLNRDIEIIGHNWKFDYEVIATTSNVRIPCTWDTMIAARLIDENERHSAGLKQLYTSLIDSNQEKYSIESLFRGVEYADLGPELFGCYASKDAKMTYDIYKWQKNYLSQPEEKRVLNLLREVEFPMVSVFGDIEIAGVSLDKKYCEKLSKKYHTLSDEVERKLSLELAKLTPKIEAWKNSPKSRLITQSKTTVKNAKMKIDQLSDPIELSSPLQLAILLYDILEMPVVDPEDERGTGEPILQKLSEQLPMCKLILEKKHIDKMLSAFVDALPKQTDEQGKIHCTFKQIGADTGRTSCTNPNLQQIPTSIDIRPMFCGSLETIEHIPDENGYIVCNKAEYFLDENNEKYYIGDIEGHTHYNDIRLTILEKGEYSCKLSVDTEHSIKLFMQYKIVGSDYSAQEPRILAHLANEDQMIQAYRENKDLYSFIASMAFNKDYWDCMEFDKDGNKNIDGKKRRSQAKAILLGLLYGRGNKSIAEQLGCTVEEAKEITEKFFTAFPKIRTFIEGNIKQAREVGYVEDFMGRKRHLEDAMLPDYTIRPMYDTSKFNPLFGSVTRQDIKTEELIEKYRTKLSQTKWLKQKKEIQKDALNNGIEIINNGAFKARAERQCTNARIQGSGGTMMKMAMLKISRDKELNNMGFRLLSTIHDELFGEVPDIYAEQCAELVVKRMCDCVENIITVPLKCDPYIVDFWYQDEYSAYIQDEFEKLAKAGKTDDEAFDIIYNEHSEMDYESIVDCIKNHTLVKK